MCAVYHSVGVSGGVAFVGVGGRLGISEHPSSSPGGCLSSDKLDRC